MTIKEYMKVQRPDKVGGRHVGCVCGCPTDYKETEHMGRWCGNGILNTTRCTECWNREFREKEPKHKPEIDVNDVIITIATLCMKKEEREKTLNTFKVFEKYGVKPIDAIELMEELREVMK